MTHNYADHHEPVDDDRDKTPDYSDMFIAGPRVVRCFSDLMVLIMGLCCFIIPIFLYLLWAHPWAGDADLAASRCVRELGPHTHGDARCAAFLAILGPESGKYIIYDRNYNATLGQLCPLSMLCVTARADLIFLSHAATSVEPEAFPFRVSPPVVSFFGRPGNETNVYVRFCATWGGSVPTPLGWLLFQAVTSTVVTIVVNTITNLQSVAELMIRLGGYIAVLKFKFFRCCCCCCCGGSSGDSSSSGGKTDESLMNDVDNKSPPSVVSGNNTNSNNYRDADEEAQAVWARELAEGRNNRLSLILRKDWIDRCFLVGNVQCLLALVSLVSGTIASIGFMLGSVPSAPEEISTFHRMGYFYVNVFGGSATSAFVSFGTTLFIHTLGFHWEMYDAAVSVLPCCGALAPIRLFCATVAAGREFMFEMMASMWLFLSRVLRKCKAFTVEDEAFPKPGVAFLLGFLCLSSIGWYTHVLVGFYFYFIPNMLIIGSGLFVLAAPTFYLTVITAWIRVQSTKTLPNTGRVVAVYDKNSTFQKLFKFCRLASTQLFYSYIGYTLWSLSANLAQSMYLDESLRYGEGYKAAIFIELSRRSQSCYMMKMYSSTMHKANTVLSLL